MKHILLAVIGLSPQIITETIYALHANQRRVDEIHIITTRKGGDRIYAELLAGDGGYFYRYLADYEINHPILFNRETIHVLYDAYGREIVDVANDDDNRMLLKKCLELTYGFTRDPDTVVYFSIAGGRKTMSSALSFAAQLYARPWDRLFHVLVSPEFEGSREFFFPPRKSVLIQLFDREARPYYKETCYAEINLVSLPFISVRDRIMDPAANRPLPPDKLMTALIRDGGERLVIHTERNCLIHKNMECDLMPARLALYLLFANQKITCIKETDTCGNCTDCYLGVSQIFEKQRLITDFYQRLCTHKSLENLSTTGITNLSMENFNMYKGKIKKNLRQAFGPYVSQKLEIRAVGTRPNKRYGLAVEKQNITIRPGLNSPPQGCNV